jgi:hypothetical protein
MMTSTQKELAAIERELVAAQTGNPAIVPELNAKKALKQQMLAKIQGVFQSYLRQNPQAFHAQINEIKVRTSQQAQDNAVLAGAAPSNAQATAAAQVQAPPQMASNFMSQMQRVPGANNMNSSMSGPLASGIPQQMQSQLQKLVQQSTGQMPLGQPMGSGLLQQTQPSMGIPAASGQQPSKWEGKITWSGQDQAQNQRENVLEAVAVARSGDMCVIRSTLESHRSKL